MQKNVSLTLSEEEARFVLSALDRVPCQGIAAARTVLVVAERIARAIRPAETPEAAGRLNGAEVAPAVAD